MLETLLEPVQTQEDDEGVDGDGVRHHSQEEKDELLKRVQQVDVDGVKPGLRVGSGSKD
jgi:hypothetical protein